MAAYQLKSSREEFDNCARSLKQNTRDRLEEVRVDLASRWQQWSDLSKEREVEQRGDTNAGNPGLEDGRPRR